MSDDLFREPNAVVFVDTNVPPVDEHTELIQEIENDFDPNYGLGPEPAHDPTDEELINKRLGAVEDQLSKLTDAVNTFGQMLDFIVKSVEGMSQLVQEKGLMGIMSMAMGGNKNG